jgi:hypothetical protein
MLALVIRIIIKVAERIEDEDASLLFSFNCDKHIMLSLGN